MCQRDNLGNSVVGRLVWRLWLAVLSLACIHAVTPAHAASRQARERLARKACLSGDYAKGASMLSDLFLDTKNPTFIFNQGRCFEQNHRYEDAISRFDEYLRVGKMISREDRADAEKHIAGCRERLALQSPQPDAPTVVQAAVAPVAALSAPQFAPFAQPAPTHGYAPPPGYAPAPAATPPSTGSQGKGLRIAGIICAAVGLAAIGTGVGLALETQSITSDAQKNGGGTQAQEDHRKTLETWGWVSYGVGAAALATGVVLYVAGWPSDKSTKVVLLPSPAPDGAAMILKGKF